MKILRATPEFLQDMYAYHLLTLEKLSEELADMFGESVEIRECDHFGFTPLKPGEQEVAIHVDINGKITKKETINGAR